MEEVCSYNKYGYCRFGENCQKKHYSEVCQHQEACKSTKTCTKRHPKNCKKKNTKQKKVAGLEVTVRILTKETRIQVNPVSAKLR